MCVCTLHIPCQSFAKVLHPATGYLRCQSFGQVLSEFPDVGHVLGCSGISTILDGDRGVNRVRSVIKIVRVRKDINRRSTVEKIDRNSIKVSLLRRERASNECEEEALTFQLFLRLNNAI